MEIKYLKISVLTLFTILHPFIKADQTFDSLIEELNNPTATVVTPSVISSEAVDFTDLNTFNISSYMFKVSSAAQLPSSTSSTSSKWHWASNALLSLLLTPTLLQEGFQIFFIAVDNTGKVFSQFPTQSTGYSYLLYVFDMNNNLVQAPSGITNPVPVIIGPSNYVNGGLGINNESVGITVNYPIYLKFKTDSLTPAEIAEAKSSAYTIPANSKPLTQFYFYSIDNQNDNQLIDYDLLDQDQLPALNTALENNSVLINMSIMPVANTSNYQFNSQAYNADTGVVIEGIGLQATITQATPNSIAYTNYSYDSGANPQFYGLGDVYPFNTTTYPNGFTAWVYIEKNLTQQDMVASALELIQASYKYLAAYTLTAEEIAEAKSSAYTILANSKPLTQFYFYGPLDYDLSQVNQLSLLNTSLENNSVLINMRIAPVSNTTTYQFTAEAYNADTGDLIEGIGFEYPVDGNAPSSLSAYIAYSYDSGSSPHLSYNFYYPFNTTTYPNGFNTWIYLKKMITQQDMVPNALELIRASYQAFTADALSSNNLTEVASILNLTPYSISSNVSSPNSLPGGGWNLNLNQMMSSGKGYAFVRDPWNNTSALFSQTSNSGVVANINVAPILQSMNSQAFKEIHITGNACGQINIVLLGFDQNNRYISDIIKQQPTNFGLFIYDYKGDLLSGYPVYFSPNNYVGLGKYELQPGAQSPAQFVMGGLGIANYPTYNYPFNITVTFVCPPGSNNGSSKVPGQNWNIPKGSNIQ